jgi:hypothetical protein
MRAALAVAVTAVVATCSAEVYFEETFDVFDKDLWVHSTQWKVHDGPPHRIIVALRAHSSTAPSAWPCKSHKHQSSSPTTAVLASCSRLCSAMQFTLAP